MLTTISASLASVHNSTMQRTPSSGVVLSLQGATRFQRPQPTIHLPASDETDSRVDISSTDDVKRHAAAWSGMSAEIVQITGRERVEFRFRAHVHLLILHEEGTRQNGETVVEGLARSTLRDCRRKLTFVPAGHEFHEWQEPRQSGRMLFFYVDPSNSPLAPETDAEDAAFAPRLFFENAALRDTALKLAAAIEHAGSDKRYVEALGVVLAHELVRLNQGDQRGAPPIRGGLSAWQERVVTAYIEEHLADPIPIAALAQLARLSTFYFCRAFKQSFGVPPHRYHTNRRIERAKALLANATPSVTDIGSRVGFSETSSFSAAFRKATGLTPTAYHRSLR